jgi:hypothetical protein
VVDGPSYRGRERGQHDLSALAVHAQDPVPVNFAEALDVAAGCLEHAQPEEPQHRHQRQVEAIGRVPASDQQSLELQMGESQRG